MQIATVAAVCSPRPIRTDWHVVPAGAFWSLRRENDAHVWGTYLTKTEAMAEGIMQARAGYVSLVEHGRDGRIQNVRSYDDWCGPDVEG